jgi:hypothetical protein
MKHKTNPTEKLPSTNPDAADILSRSACQNHNKDRLENGYQAKTLIQKEIAN